LPLITTSDAPVELRNKRCGVLRVPFFPGAGSLRYGLPRQDEKSGGWLFDVAIIEIASFAERLCPESLDTGQSK
jgi:hypothetical protein